MSNNDWSYPNPLKEFFPQSGTAFEAATQACFNYLKKEKKDALSVPYILSNLLP